MTFSRSLLVAAGVAAFVTSALAAIVFSQPVHNHLALFILMISTLVCATMLMQCVLSRYACVPTMLVLIYLLIFNIVPALFQAGFDAYFWRLLSYNEATTATAALLTLLFLVFFAIGQALAPDRHYRAAVHAVLDSERYPRTVYLAAFAGIALLVGLVPIQLFGVGTLLQSRGTLGDAVFAGLDQTSMGLIVYLPRAVVFTGFVLMLYGLTRRVQGSTVRRYTVFVPLLLALLPMQAVVNFPGAQSRFWLFGMLIAMSLMFISFRTIGRRAVLLMVFVVGAFTVFPVSQQINRQEGFNFDVEVPPLEEYMTHGDLDGFQTTMNTIVYVDRFGHTYGRQILSAVLYFIPRSVWSGKSLATGNMTSTALGFDFNNLSAPIVAELYIDGSFFAVILGALGLGYGYRRLDYTFTAANEVGGVTLHRVLLALICGFTIILMRGSLLGVMSPIATSIGAVFLILKAPHLIAWVTRNPLSTAADSRS